MAKSNIDWTEHVWNPIAGCTKCSPGCENCYAEKMSARLAEIYRRFPKQRPSLWKYRQVITNKKWNGNIICDKDALEIPLKRKKPTTYFVCSMSGLFHPKVPFEFILKIIGIAIATPWHTYQILTKREKRMYDFFAPYPDGWLITESMKHTSFSYEFFAAEAVGNFVSETQIKKANDYWKTNFDQSERGKLDGPVPHPIPNLHFGVSISTQKEADEKIPIALKIPAAVHYLSLEPLLEGIDLRFRSIKCGNCGFNGDACYECETAYYKNRPLGINQVIIGCESKGRMAGRFQDGFTEAAISLVEQCKAAGVKVFVKQIPHEGRVIRKEKDWPDCWPKQLRYQEI
jgi:protein gp37